MKKLLATLLCLTLLMGMTAFGAQAEEEITLELWYWQSSLNDDLIAQVSEQFPGVKINANKFNSENMQEKVHTALASNAPMPDILVMDDWVSTLIPYADRFYNLYDAPFNAAEYQDQYLEWKWKKAETPDGKLIGFPIDAGPTVMYYRADLFEAAGLPTEPADVAAAMSTWEDALAAAKKMKDATGATMFDFVTQLYWMMICQQEQGLVNEQNEFVGDSEACKTAFYNAAAFADYVVGMSSMYGTEWAAAVGNGDVAAYCGAVWTIDMLKNSAPDTAGNWRVTTQPGGPGNHGGSCMGIPATSEHPEEAFKVITWLQNAQNQMVQLNENSLFPTNLETLSNPELLKADEFFGGQVINEIFVESAKNIPPQYVGLNYAAYRQCFYDELLLVQDTGKNVDDAWNDALEACALVSILN